jgi:cytochrome P450
LSSWIEEHLKLGAINEENAEIMKGAAAVMFIAGFETTSATIIAFILLMVNHPRVLQKAQKEMDEVVGTDRLPNFDDKASLPYLECVIYETFR